MGSGDAKLNNFLLTAQGGRCQYCGSLVDGREEVDHYVPAGAPLENIFRHRFVSAPIQRPLFNAPEAPEDNVFWTLAGITLAAACGGMVAYAISSGMAPLGSSAPRPLAPSTPLPPSRFKVAPVTRTERLLSLLAEQPGMPIADLARLAYDDDSPTGQSRVRAMLGQLRKAGRVRSTGHGRWEVVERRGDDVAYVEEKPT